MTASSSSTKKPPNDAKKVKSVGDVPPMRKKRRKKKEQDYDLSWMCLVCFNDQEDGKCSCLKKQEEAKKKSVGYENFEGSNIIKFGLYASSNNPFYTGNSLYLSSSRPFDDMDLEQFVSEYKRRYGL